MINYKLNYFDIFKFINESFVFDNGVIKIDDENIDESIIKYYLQCSKEEANLRYKQFLDAFKIIELFKHSIKEDDVFDAKRRDLFEYVFVSLKEELEEDRLVKGIISRFVSKDSMKVAALVSKNFDNLKMFLLSFDDFISNSGYECISKIVDEREKIGCLNLKSLDNSIEILGNEESNVETIITLGKKINDLMFEFKKITSCFDEGDAYANLYHSQFLHLKHLSENFINEFTDIVKEMREHVVDISIKEIDDEEKVARNKLKHCSLFKELDSVDSFIDEFIFKNDELNSAKDIVDMLKIAQPDVYRDMVDSYQNNNVNIDN